MVLNKRDLDKAFSPSKHKQKPGCSKKMARNCGNTEQNATTSAPMKVVVRIRPPNLKEQGVSLILKEVDDQMLIFDPKAELEPFYFHGAKQTQRDMLKKSHKEMKFVFDRVFGFSATNEDVFHGSTKDIIISLLDGYNCSVFVYGATGAGKTYTMLGSKTSPGITYLTMVELYDQMKNLEEEKTYELGISYLEVYNENVVDLLSPSGPLHLRDNGNNGVVITGLKVHRIESANELLSLLAQGNKNRSQHPTDANAESSRSHAVFQVYVRMTSKTTSQVKLVKLSMIDLAGSERGAATGYSGMRFTEGSKINTSLLALGNCINSLADGQKHIPYRDSKLTRILKDCLGGNCCTVMIANVSPAHASYDDTYNTLKYATRARSIKSTMKKNIVSVEFHISHYVKLVEELKKENESLKNKLKEAEAVKHVRRTSPRYPAVKVMAVATQTETETPMETETATQIETETASPMPTIHTLHDRNTVKVENWKEKWSKLNTDKCELYRSILSLESKVKVLQWRSQLKKMTGKRLEILSVNRLELFKRQVCMTTSLVQFEGLAKGLISRLQKLWGQTNVLRAQETALKAELMQNGLQGLLEQVDLKEAVEMERMQSQMQMDHMYLLMNLQQTELEKDDLIITNLSSTLHEYYLLLQGHKRVTNEMGDGYEKLVRMLEGNKKIAFEDEQTTDENRSSKQNTKDIMLLPLSTLHSCVDGTDMANLVGSVLSTPFEYTSSAVSHGSIDNMEQLVSEPDGPAIVEGYVDILQDGPEILEHKSPDLNATFVLCEETNAPSSTKKGILTERKQENINSNIGKSLLRGFRAISPRIPKKMLKIDERSLMNKENKISKLSRSETPAPIFRRPISSVAQKAILKSITPKKTFPRLLHSATPKPAVLQKGLVRSVSLKEFPPKGPAKATGSKLKGMKPIKI